MKCKRHNPEQIIRMLRTAEQLLNYCQAFADVCRPWRCFTHLPPLKAALRRHAGSGGQTADPAGEGDAQGVGGGKPLSPERRRKAVDDLRNLFRFPSRSPAVLWVKVATPQHPAPSRHGSLHRGGQATTSSPGDRHRSHRLGAADGLQRHTSSQDHRGSTDLPNPVSSARLRLQ